MRTTTYLFFLVMGMAFLVMAPSLGLAVSEATANETLQLTTGDPLGLSLIIAGLLLVIAEIFLISHGLLALSGTLFFILGSALVIQSANPAVRLLWANFLASGLAICAGISVLTLYALRLYRQGKSYKFSLAGQKALIIQWNESGKRIEIDGSFWNAESLSGKQYASGEWAVIHLQNNLTLYIE